MGKRSNGTRGVNSGNAASYRTTAKGDGRFKEITNREGYESYSISGKSSDGQIDVLPRTIGAKDNDVKYEASVSFGNGKILRKEFKTLKKAQEYVKKNLK